MMKTEPPRCRCSCTLGKSISFSSWISTFSLLLLSSSMTWKVRIFSFLKSISSWSTLLPILSVLEQLGYVDGLCFKSM